MIFRCNRFVFFFHQEEEWSKDPISEESQLISGGRTPLHIACARDDNYKVMGVRSFIVNSECGYSYNTVIQGANVTGKKGKMCNISLHGKYRKFDKEFDED